MCDNGDGLERAPRDAFRVTSGRGAAAERGSGDGHVACEEIPRMALQPWFGECHC